MDAGAAPIRIKVVKDPQRFVLLQKPHAPWQIMQKEEKKKKKKGKYKDKILPTNNMTRNKSAHEQQIKKLNTYNWNKTC